MKRAKFCLWGGITPTDQLEGSLEGEDLGVLVVTKVVMRQKRALAAEKANPGLH